MKAKLAFLSLSLVYIIRAESTSESDLVTICPKVTCSEPLGENVCFMHSGTNPVEWVKL
jgi:hypothetical protein